MNSLQANQHADACHRGHDVSGRSRGVIDFSHVGTSEVDFERALIAIKAANRSVKDTPTLSVQKVYAGSYAWRGSDRVALLDLLRSRAENGRVPTTDVDRILHTLCAVRCVTGQLFLAPRTVGGRYLNQVERRALHAAYHRAANAHRRICAKLRLSAALNGDTYRVPSLVLPVWTSSAVIRAADKRLGRSLKEELRDWEELCGEPVDLGRPTRSVTMFSPAPGKMVKVNRDRRDHDRKSRLLAECVEANPGPPKVHERMPPQKTEKDRKPRSKGKKSSAGQAMTGQLAALHADAVASRDALRDAQDETRDLREELIRAKAHQLAVAAEHRPKKDDIGERVVNEPEAPEDVWADVRARMLKRGSTIGYWTTRTKNVFDFAHFNSEPDHVTRVKWGMRGGGASYGILTWKPKVRIGLFVHLGVTLLSFCLLVMVWGLSLRLAEEATKRWSWLESWGFSSGERQFFDHGLCTMWEYLWEGMSKEECALLKAPHLHLARKVEGTEGFIRFFRVPLFMGSFGWSGHKPVQALGYVPIEGQGLDLDAAWRFITTDWEELPDEQGGPSIWSSVFGPKMRTLFLLLGVAIMIADAVVLILVLSLPLMMAIWKRIICDPMRTEDLDMVSRGYYVWRLKTEDSGYVPRETDVRSSVALKVNITEQPEYVDYVIQVQYVPPLWNLWLQRLVGISVCDEWTTRTAGEIDMAACAYMHCPQKGFTAESVASGLANAYCRMAHSINAPKDKLKIGPEIRNYCNAVTAVIFNRVGKDFPPAEPKVCVTGAHS